MLIVRVVTTLFVWQKKKENLISKCKTDSVDKAGKKTCFLEIFEAFTCITPSGDHKHAPFLALGIYL